MKTDKELIDEVLDILIPFQEHKPYSGQSNSSVERKIKLGQFPKPVRLGPALRAFRVRDLKEYQRDPMNYRAKESSK